MLLRNAISLLFLVTFCDRTIQRVIKNDNKVIPGLYDENDNIEVLTTHNIQSIYGSDRAAFVEFYSHWCGACQRYSKHWKELGRMTKRWHSSVIRVSAINCADPMNADVCKAFDITAYPSIKLVPAHAQYENKNHDATLVKVKENDLLIKDMIEFLENQAGSIPSSWPELSPYKSTLENLFNKNKYAVLIAEESSSHLGRQLILDNAKEKNKLPIKRITKESNSALFQKLNVESSPSAYLIKSDSTFELLNREIVQKFIKDHSKDSAFIQTNDQIKEENNQETTNRVKFINLIDDLLRFIKDDQVEVEKGADLNDSKDPNQIGKPIVQIDNKQDRQSDSYLTSPLNRVFMQDLESGLSYMLRSEVSLIKFISGEKLLALKEFLRILVKFFPGRKPVRNYLTYLYENIKNKNEITGNQWSILVKKQDADLYLPSEIEWRHCKGSSPNYRGYPCSLWTIFHVLTVSQVEQEKTKQTPFSDNYDVQEVVKSIRFYILNFFSCQECSKNFEKETENWKSHLINPNDAVLYIWSVHNKINERLKKEGAGDPVYPKVVFPTKTQCPKCYASDSNNQFNDKEIVQYLTSFYSKFQIEGVMELDEKKALVEKLPADLQANGLGVSGQLQDKRVDSYETPKSATNQTVVNLSIFLILMTVLGLFFMFYGFNRSRERVKAHII